MRDPSTAATRLREVVRSASRGLIDREALLELIVLAAVAGEHVLVIGPPGTAKSEAARRISKLLGGMGDSGVIGSMARVAFFEDAINNGEAGAFPQAAKVVQALIARAESAFQTPITFASPLVLLGLNGTGDEARLMLSELDDDTRSLILSVWSNDARAEFSVATADDVAGVEAALATLPASSRGALEVTVVVRRR